MCTGWTTTPSEGPPVLLLSLPVSKEGGPLRVDKDVRLFKEFFDLDHLDYQDMSPLIGLPRFQSRLFSLPLCSMLLSSFVSFF